MPKSIETVAIITKKDVHHAKHNGRIIKKLFNYLKRHKKKILIDKNCADLFPKHETHTKAYLLKHADLAITLGGDGTILKTARDLPRKKVLLFPVNFGNLGFLTESTPEKMFEALDKILLEGNFHTDRRTILRVTLYRGNKKINTYLALNDAVINQGSFARLIELSLEIDNRKMVRFKGDGLIVATPSGSTAHSLSAGGPIVHPYIECMVITPICASSLSMRPIIVPDKKQLSVHIETRRREENPIIGLTIDGQDMTILKYGDTIKIRRSKRQVYIARTSHRYYRMLRSKLSWGEV